MAAGIARKKGRNGNKKWGRNKALCERYRLNNQAEKNAKKRQARHLKLYGPK